SHFRRPRARPVASSSALPPRGLDPARRAPAREATVPQLDLQRLWVRAEFIRPLAGKNVVFTGQLEHLSRADAESLAIRLGGTCQSSVTAATDLLVVGKNGSKPPEAAPPSNAMEQTARRFNAAGGSVQIVGEHDFLGFVIAPS
ncbi:MAG: BRCT domain-containing protein, partial [Novipirellula sp. JB048]